MLKLEATLVLIKIKPSTLRIVDELQITNVAKQSILLENSLNGCVVGGQK